MNIGNKSAVLFTALLIVLGLCMPAHASTSDDVEWKVIVDSTTLHWADSVTNGGYVIQAGDFDEDGLVYITISKDGQVKELAPLETGDTLIAEDEIKVYVREVNPDKREWGSEIRNPTVTIQIYRRALPSLGLILVTDEYSYDPKSYSSPSTITATITVRNTGDAKIKNVDLTIDTGGLELTEGDLTYHYDAILKSESTCGTMIKMKVPILWDTSSFTISAEAKGYDIKGAEYSGDGSISVSIDKKWELFVTKSMTENAYMGETVNTFVNIRNTGICDIDMITVTDEMIEGLELINNITLEKAISLKSGECASNLFEYDLKPISSGTFTAPVATAIFTAPNGEEYTVSSGYPRVTINGPNIILTKKVSTSNVNPGDEVTVTVDVLNAGNVDASVTTSCSLPATGTFVEGDRGFKEMLSGGEGFKSFSYVMRMETRGKVELPSATANFVDMQGYKGTEMSNKPVIIVGSPVDEDEKSIAAGKRIVAAEPKAIQEGTRENVDEQIVESTPAPPIRKNVDGFEAVFGCISFISVYFLFRHKKV